MPKPRAEAKERRLLGRVAAFEDVIACIDRLALAPRPPSMPPDAAAGYLAHLAFMRDRLARGPVASRIGRAPRAWIAPTPTDGPTAKE